MCRGCREVYSPIPGVLRGIQPRKVDQAFSVLRSPFWRIGDGGKIACEFAVELHAFDCIPRLRMEEKNCPGGNGQAVPEEIPSTNVVQLMAQNNFEIGAVLFQANIGEEDGRPNKAECCRR